MYADPDPQCQYQAFAITAGSADMLGVQDAEP